MFNHFTVVHYALCAMPYALCPLPYALCALPYALCDRYYLEFYLQMIIILCLAINLIWRQVHADLRVPL